MPVVELTEISLNQCAFDIILETLENCSRKKCFLVSTLRLQLYYLSIKKTDEKVSLGLVI